MAEQPRQPPEGDETPREAGQHEKDPTERKAKERLPSEDEREMEGWTQPESSAQKTPKP